MDSRVVITKNEDELADLFTKAKSPLLHDLVGRAFSVFMLTGRYKWLNIVGDRKIFYRQDENLVGHNVSCHYKWGYFSVGTSICEVDMQKAVLLNYNQSVNHGWVKSIRDFVRCVEPKELYLGRFCRDNPLNFCGYFTLTPIAVKEGRL